MPDQDCFHDIPEPLHESERQETALARQLKLPILVDKRDGRAAARQFAFPSSPR